MFPRTNRSATTAALVIAAAILAATPGAMGQQWLNAIDPDGRMYTINRTTGTTFASSRPSLGVQSPVGMTHDAATSTVFVSTADALYYSNAYFSDLHEIGPYGVPSLQMQGIAWDSESRTLYGTSDGDLYTIDTSSGAATFAGSTGISGESDIVYDCCGRMYMVSNSTDSIYQVDLATAAPTLVAQLNGPTNPSGLALVDYNQRLYMVCNETHMLYAFDFSTHATTAIGSTGPSNLVGLVWSFSGCSVYGCPEDYDQDGGLTGGDIATFFDDFESGRPCADMDQDGGITCGDIVQFFAFFESGSC